MHMDKSNIKYVLYPGAEYVSGIGAYTCMFIY